MNKYLRNECKTILTKFSLQIDINLRQNTKTMVLIVTLYESRASLAVDLIQTMGARHLNTRLRTHLGGLLSCWPLKYVFTTTIDVPVPNANNTIVAPIKISTKKELMCLILAIQDAKFINLRNRSRHHKENQSLAF